MAPVPIAGCYRSCATCLADSRQGCISGRPACMNRLQATFKRRHYPSCFARLIAYAAESTTRSRISEPVSLQSCKSLRRQTTAEPIARRQHRAQLEGPQPQPDDSWRCRHPMDSRVTLSRPVGIAGDPHTSCRVSHKIRYPEGPGWGNQTPPSGERTTLEYCLSLAPPYGSPRHVHLGNDSTSSAVRSGG